MIGTVPEPDLADIDAIDFETDRQKAIGNNSSVQSARHANAGTTSEPHLWGWCRPMRITGGL